MYLKYYLEKLEYEKMPYFMAKYLYLSSIIRLKKVGYFCGMDYASKDIYRFREKITRYDHSVTTALLTYKLTNDKKATLAALFHDIATPCFSHVIDYMNKDYDKQESTEKLHNKMLLKDKKLMYLLSQDNLKIEDIIDFKSFHVVDNDRPKLCADRLDGIILTGIGWTKDIEKADIDNIINDVILLKNENNEDEIGFMNYNVANKVINVSKTIDLYCHSLEDNYMMELLAKITRYAILKKYISYNDLYYYDEEKLFGILDSKNDNILNKYLKEFRTKKKTEIKEFDNPKVKNRSLTPLVNGKRIK